MTFYRGGIDATIKYKATLNGEILQGYALAWDIDKGAAYWVKVILGQDAEVLQADITGSHPDEIGAFYKAREGLDLDFSLNRLDNSIESFEELQEVANIWDYASKSRSCPSVGSKKWFDFVELIDIWLKQRKQYGF